VEVDFIHKLSINYSFLSHNKRLCSEGSPPEHSLFRTLHSCRPVRSNSRTRGRESHYLAQVVDASSGSFGVSTRLPTSEQSFSRSFSSAANWSGKSDWTPSPVDELSGSVCISTINPFAPAATDAFAIGSTSSRRPVS